MDGERNNNSTRSPLLPVAAVVAAAAAALAIEVDTEKPVYETAYSVVSDQTPAASELLAARDAAGNDLLFAVVAAEPHAGAKVEVAYRGDDPNGPDRARAAAQRVADVLTTPPLTEQQVAERLYKVDLRLAEARNTSDADPIAQKQAAAAKQALLVQRTALLLDGRAGQAPRVERVRSVRNGTRHWLKRAAPLALVGLLVLAAGRLLAPDRRRRLGGQVAAASLLASPTHSPEESIRAAA